MLRRQGAGAAPPVDFTTNPTPERLAAYGRYLRLWALLVALSERKYIPRRDLVSRIFAECPAELDYCMEASLVMAVNVRTASKMYVGGDNSGVAAPGSTTSLTLPGTYVVASSPRLRVAFRVLAADDKLRAQATRVAAALSLWRLRREEEALLKRLPEVTAERGFAAQQLSLLLARDTALRGTLVKEMLNAGMGSRVTSSVPGNTGAGGITLAGTAAMVEGSRVWHLTLPVADDTPMDGAPGLAGALARAEAAVTALDGEVAGVRQRLAEVRAGIVAAQRAAEVAVPGTEATLAAYTAANDRTAAALGAAMDAPSLTRAAGRIDGDREGDDASDERWRNTLAGGGAAPPVPPPSSQLVDSDGAAAGAGDDMSASTALQAADTALPPGARASLEIYRGNTARAIEMYENTAGYTYRNGSWEYSSGGAPPPPHTNTGVAAATTPAAASGGHNSGSHHRRRHTAGAATAAAWAAVAAWRAGARGSAAAGASASESGLAGMSAPGAMQVEDGGVPPGGPAGGGDGCRGCQSVCRGLKRGTNEVGYCQPRRHLLHFAAVVQRDVTRASPAGRHDGH